MEAENEAQYGKRPSTQEIEAASEAQYGSPQKAARVGPYGSW